MPAAQIDEYCREKIDDIDALVENFSDYEPINVSRAYFQRWMSQFSPQHFELAYKVASSIKYYSHNLITQHCRSLKGLIEEQRQSQGVEPQDVFYVPFGSIAESGEAILRRYINVNRLDRSNRHIQYAHQLPEIIFRVANPMIVFFDDFIGTGTQVTNYWKDVLCNLIPDYQLTFISVIAACEEGISYIEQETPLRVIPLHRISSKSPIRLTTSQKFSKSEVLTIKKYCSQFGNHPLGFKNQELLISFAYGTPNNALSIIRGSEKQKPSRGLLPSFADL